MNVIEERLALVQARIRTAEQQYERRPGSVRLLAVSKTQPADAVRALADAGQPAFGENYVQEALDKIDALADLELEWHFIGPLQSNKTKLVAGNFDWVHSVDRLKIARRLSEHRSKDRAPLNICIQVNVSGEASKAGCAPSEAAALADAIRELPGLALRGLMAIPAPAQSLEAQRKPLARLRVLKEEIEAGGIPLDTLSMGMSADLEAAVAEGATLVRIGTALFGPRR